VGHLLNNRLRFRAAEHGIHFFFFSSPEAGAGGDRRDLVGFGCWQPQATSNKPQANEAGVLPAAFGL